MLIVVMAGRPIAELERLRTGRLRLRYTESEPRVILSVNLPGTQRRHADDAVRPWIEGLFPDRPELLRAWRRTLGVTGADSFDLLAAVGEDVAGAAQFVRPERLDHILERRGSVSHLSEEELADLVSASLHDIPIVDEVTGTGRFSLAGAQSKLALQRTSRGWALPEGAEPSSHILKPPIPGLPDQDLIEALTMRTAQQLGLATSTVRLELLGGNRVLAAQRYDRTQVNGRWFRLHQEDMCQAMGVDPDRKYEAQGGPNTSAIADLLRRVSSHPEDDVMEFARAVIFNALVGGTDAHARNYSLLHHGGSVRLAPLYDLNTWAAYGSLSNATSSMSVGREFRLSRLTSDHWRWFAAALGLAEETILDEVDRQRDAIPHAFETEAERLGDAAMASAPVQRAVAEITDFMR